MIRDFSFGPIVLKTLHGKQWVDPDDHSEGLWWTRYLTRFSIGRLAIHVFWRGDADQECHDHPWDFWTFPLVSYLEIYRDDRGLERFNRVQRFRLHHRPAEYAHRVVFAIDRHGNFSKTGTIVTLVWKGRKRREWGFYCPEGWTLWKDFIGRGGCE